MVRLKGAVHLGAPHQNTGFDSSFPPWIDEDKVSSAVFVAKKQFFQENIFVARTWRWGGQKWGLTRHRTNIILNILTLSTSWDKNSSTWGGENSSMSPVEKEASSASVAWRRNHHDVSSAPAEHLGFTNWEDSKSNQVKCWLPSNGKTGVSNKPHTVEFWK